MSKLWRWERGRQTGGYDKLLLAQSSWLKFDLYLLRFPKGSAVPKHTDPSQDGYEHHRFNLNLNTVKGGYVWYAKYTPGLFWYAEKRWLRFRPDTQEHWMDPIKEGTLWMLSFGWLRKSKGA